MLPRKILFLNLNNPWVSQLPPKVFLEGGQSPWNGVFLEGWQIPPLEIPSLVPQQTLVSLQLNEPVKVNYFSKAGTRSQIVTKNEIFVDPCWTETPPGSWNESVELLRLAIEPGFIRQILLEIDAPHSFEMARRHGGFDPVIQGILLALKAEFEAGCPSGRLLGESLGTGLVVYLAATYATHPRGAKTYKKGLDGSKLKIVLDYMQTHFNQNLGLEQLARQVGVSQYHFSRLFKQSMGLTPHQYLTRCRLVRAHDLLLKTELTVVEIAQQVGFFDQSHLTRYFIQYFGVSPAELRRR